jgi:hypothetical protein
MTATSSVYNPRKAINKIFLFLYTFGGGGKQEGGEGSGSACEPSLLGSGNSDAVRLMCTTSYHTSHALRTHTTHIGHSRVKKKK